MPRSDGCRRIRASQISRAVNCLRFLNIRPPLRAFYFLYIPFPLPPQMCPLSPVVIHLSVSLQPTPRLFLLPYCPPLQPVPIFLLPPCPLPFYFYPLLPAPCPLPFSSCPSATHGSSPSQKAALPSPSQKTPSQTVQPPPKRLIPLFCPQHSLKTKIAIEF